MKFKKKVAILTTHNVDNYGAILQTYSTFNYIKQISDPIIINFENPMFKPSLKLIRYSGLSSYKSCIKDILRIRSRYSLIKKFREFIKDNLNLTSKVSREKLNSLDFLNNFDVLLVGSDQVWNPDITNIKKKLNSDYFFETDTSEKIRKISYASSFGGKNFQTGELEKINTYLKKFYKISVREENTLRFLNQENQKKAQSVLDPVFLTEKKSWQEMANKSNVLTNVKNNDYILVYSVVRSKMIKVITGQIKKNTNFKIITIDPNLLANTNNDKKVSNAGPIDFLSLFSNASFIVTDSFHGSAFSLIFEKKFLTIASDVKYSNRIIDLLNNIGCEKNIILKQSESQDLEDIEKYKISEQSKIKLDELILKSKNFIDEAILSN